MATAQSTAKNGKGQFLRISEVASLVNVHEQTLRRAAASGELLTYKLPSGHRRFLHRDVMAWMGQEKKDSDEGRKLIIYARVSTNKQARGFRKGDGESDLTRQIDLLKAKAIELHGRAPDEIFADCGSGLSFTRRNFVKLIDSMLAGKLNGATLLVTYPDRLCRFGRELVEQVAKHHDIAIHFVESSNEISDEEELAADVLGIITHYSAKLYGKRAADKKRKNLSPECLKRTKELYDSGLSLKQVSKVLNEEGFKTEEGAPITGWLLIKRFSTNAKPLLDKALPKSESSIADFIASECQSVQPDARIRSADVYRAYCDWCKGKGYHAARIEKLGIGLKAAGYKPVYLNPSKKNGFAPKAIGYSGLQVASAKLSVYFVSERPHRNKASQDAK